MYIYIHIYLYTYIHIYLYIFFFFYTFMCKNMFGFIVFTVAEGELMKPTVAAGRSFDLCSCSNVFSCVCFFLCMSLTEITVKSSFSICIFRYCSPNQYGVPKKKVHISNQSIFWNGNMVSKLLKSQWFDFSNRWTYFCR